MRNDPAELLADQVLAVEFLEILSAHFGGAEGDRRGGAYFPRSDMFAVRVRVVNERISELEFGPGADADLAGILRAKVQAALLEDQAADRAKRIVFAGIPVAGAFYDELTGVGLTGLLAEAPRPPAFIGDHPLLIEVPFISSPDPWISLHRRWRVLDEWTWALNAILLHRLKTYHSHQAWYIAIDPLADPPSFKAQWGTEGYAWSGFGSPIDWSSASAMPMTPDDEYYSCLGVSVGETLPLPGSLAAHLQAFSRLATDERGRFLQAGHWLTAAIDLWGTHMGSWYIAQVAAIESIVHRREPPHPCPECGQERLNQPTKRFKDFISRYAPGSGTRSDLDDLYRVRSGLVHGSALLHHDSPFGGGMLSFVTNEREPMDRLSRLVTISLVNWLGEAAQTSGLGV